MGSHRDEGARRAPRRRGLGANVCDGIARETAEGRRAVSGSLAGMFPARRLPPRLQTPNSRQKLALFWGGGCRATAAPARRSMASAEIARINGLDILASDLRRV